MDSNDKTKSDALIQTTNECGLISRSATLTKRGLESLRTLDRIVRFPSDVAIGNVYLIDREPYFEPLLKYFQAIQKDPFTGVARPAGNIAVIRNVIGDLRVPCGKHVVLEILDNNNLHLISRLAFDSIQGLYFGDTLDSLEIPNFSNLRELKFLRYPILAEIGKSLSYLSHFGLLTHLDLTGTKVTDSELSHLSKLKSLTDLSLEGTGITDAGMPYLANLTSLRCLNLFNTNVTGASSVYLSGLNSLSDLDFEPDGITDEDLSFLSRLTCLSYLDLFSAQITDLGLSHISKITFLTYLTIHSPEITDVGMSYLSKLRSLEILDMSSPNLTDEGLPHLYSLQRLRMLFLSDTLVSQKGIDKLQARLPSCQLSIC